MHGCSNFSDMSLSFTMNKLYIKVLIEWTRDLLRCNKYKLFLPIISSGLGIQDFLATDSDV